MLTHLAPSFFNEYCNQVNDFSSFKLIEYKTVKFIYEHLIAFGYVLKLNRNAEKLSLEQLLKLFDSNNGEGIYLTVIDADKNDGWLSIKPNMPMLSIEFSYNLQFALHFIQILLMSKDSIKWRDASKSLPQKNSIYMKYSKWCLVITKKGNMNKSVYIIGKHWSGINSDDEVVKWTYVEELPFAYKKESDF
jgi:hypothetical protein